MEEVLYKRTIKDLYYHERELAYQEAKLKFLIFMSGKKRLNDEIVEFLSTFEIWIKNRLESIVLIKLSEKEIDLTKVKIDELKSNIIADKKLMKIQEDKWKKVKKEWELATKMKPKQTTLLTEAQGSYNGIEIWNPEEALIDEAEEEIVEEETNE